MLKRYCNNCDNEVIEETDKNLKKEYPYVCKNCEENMYEFETYLKEDDVTMKKIKTTQEYFNIGIDELLFNNSDGYTKEELKLFDDGLEVVFFDNEKELEEEKEQFKKYTQSKKYEIKATLQTINKRIAIVLI
ncbi:hypothetical protein [Clostridium tagluense]|uniref:Uncharacterized protein n=1 Tax=Clostridium tagluense TaxID=360422 RepID=A0A401USS3_9CLOT|nr:hypothetical protein [Clostridium tagluense]GCD12609.1 hypothetical protein Ctaglu_42320 [Clostridium tagluense]